MFWANLLLLISSITTLRGKSVNSNRVITDSLEISTPVLVTFIGHHNTSGTAPLKSSDVREFVRAWNLLQLLPTVDAGIHPPHLSTIEPYDGIPILNIEDYKGPYSDDDVADLCRRSLYAAASYNGVAADVGVDNSSSEGFSNSTNCGTVQPENFSANLVRFKSNNSIPSTTQNADQSDEEEHSLKHSTDINQTNTGTATGIHSSERALQVQEGSTKRLLGRFSFKGFGLCAEKSVLQWDALGVGVRVPISPNFPEYDRNVNLPKIGAFLAVYYPHHYKITVSASLTLGSMMFGELT